MSDTREVADRRRGLFEQSAERYHAMRPPYPAAMYEDLAVLGGLRRGSEVIEIGSGTGLATAGLVERGYRVRCIEPGENMAAIAKRDLGSSIEIVPVRFEDWQAEPGSVDLVFAATSWMWVSPEVGYSKAATLLREDGALALAWQLLVALSPDGVGEAIDEVYRRVAPELSNTWKAQQTVHDGWAEKIEQSGYFDGPEVRRYRYQRDFDASSFVASAFTYGMHEGLEPARRGALEEGLAFVIDDQFGGSVTRLEGTELLVAQKR